LTLTILALYDEPRNGDIMTTIKNNLLKLFSPGLYVLAIILGSLGPAMTAHADGALLQGRVEENSVGVMGTVVTATAPGSTVTLYTSDLTDSGGDFALVFESGTYNLHFTPPIGSGLASVVYNNYTINGGDSFVVSLSPLDSSTKTLSGNLTDNLNNPLPGLKLNVYTNDHILRGSTQTDSTGSYSLNLPAGLYSEIELQNPTSLNVNGAVLPSFTAGQNHEIAANLTSGNVVQNFKLNLVKMNIISNDTDGNPAQGSRFSFGFKAYGEGATLTNSGTIAPSSIEFPGLALLNDQNSSYSSYLSSFNGAAPIDNSGTYTILVPEAFYSIPHSPLRLASINQTTPAFCVTYADGSKTCTADTITPWQDVKIICKQGDSQCVATPSEPNGLSAVSPTLQPVLSWFKGLSSSDTYNVYRDGTRIATTTDTTYTDTSVSVGTYSYYVTAINAVGESAPSEAINVAVKDDITPPTINNLSWSANPVPQGQNTTLSATVTDDGSGVSSVQYSIEGGTPQPMSYNTSTRTWRATFGSNLAVNTYNITLTATDNAGDTSAGTTDVLAVYTTNNGYVTGHAKMVPAANDTLPIALDGSKNPAQIVLGFTNITAPTSGSFDMDYVIKRNQNSFSLSSTSINWVLVSDSNHASVLGYADLTTYVGGVKNVTHNIPVRFDITIGSNGSQSQVVTYIFNSGDNPYLANPTYIINDPVITNGSNLMVHP
jgi:hypothetical protein